MRLASLFAVLLLAGCVAPGAPGPLASPPEVARPTALEGPLALTLQDCTNTGGLFRVPAADAAPYLPEGFEALPASLVPGSVQMFVEGMRCAHTILADGGDAGEARALYAELEVQPPPEYEVEQGDSTIPVLFLASPAPVADVLVQWRFAGAAPADVAREETTTPLAQLVQVSAGGAALSVAMAEPLTQGTQPGHVRQFGVADGAVVSVVDVDFSEASCTQGAAAMRVEGDVALLDDALPAATGGRCAGYNLELSLTRWLG